MSEQKYQFRDPSKCEVAHPYPDDRYWDNMDTPRDIIPVPAPPRMTQEAWAVVEKETGKLCRVKLDIDHARSQQSAWGESQYMLVRIPPLPMEGE